MPGRTDEAIARLRGLIVSGELRPGSRLPAERDLCNLLGMSRGMVREAVKALEVARVLDVRRGDGTYVTSLEPQLLLQGIGFAVQLLQDDDLADVMHVRRVLEAEATALAAANADADLLSELSLILDAMRASLTEQEKLTAQDAAFHDRVAAASRNPTLSTLLNGLSGKTLRARIWRGVNEAGSADLTLQQHEAIYAAIEARDVEGARAASVVHVATSERWLRTLLHPES
ncbi:FadR/GntR family transcriptional regulator [Tenggerimyces flavus]|uniref:FadR/GntR family transcriptional regulator n=1 Tax=Tenggerimyces flavus TaxID=1708749 RepID=A0ABV7YHC7_9ACTN|nr:FadR/GntR family transcriptional regulator [Tenggerimyces flavus]MBM7789990.1 GntR family transcriptional repressor for pyruvate dehydrogenase complex [Tenggerimyces flavus]